MTRHYNIVGGGQFHDTPLISENYKGINDTNKGGTTPRDRPTPPL